MEVPLKISALHVTLSPAIEALLRKEATKLERYHTNLTRCEVVVEGTSGRQRNGTPVAVRLHLGVRGDELAIDRQEGDDLRGAIRQAFSAGRRRLQDYQRKQRGLVKSKEPPPSARVSRLFGEEGYGFLETAEGREVYFHRNSVLEPGFDGLEIGSVVCFSEEQGDEGPQASSVLPLVGRVAAS